MFKEAINLYQKYERYFSTVGFLSGLVLTPLTLTRVDALLENAWVVIHLVIAIFGIFILNFLENRIERGRVGAEYRDKIHFWISILIQFAFGNIFATFFFFYFRSSSLSVSWPFLLLLAVLLVGNEIWKKHYNRLTFQLATLFTAVYAFSIYILPVLLKKMGDGIFLLSGLASVIFVLIVMTLLSNFSKERFRKSKKGIIFSLTGIFFVINALYFTNIIPPIPLSLVDSGIYHGLARNADGNYIAYAEGTDWTDYFKLYREFSRYNEEPVYIYGAVFSPTDLSTMVYHQWRYFDTRTGKWKDSTKIEISIVGGREGGYRTYSVKHAVFEGLWMVDVITESGQRVGRVKFKIQDVSSSPILEKVEL